MCRWLPLAIVSLLQHAIISLLPVVRSRLAAAVRHRIAAVARRRIARAARAIRLGCYVLCMCAKGCTALGHAAVRRDAVRRTTVDRTVTELLWDVGFVDAATEVCVFCVVLWGVRDVCAGSSTSSNLPKLRCRFASDAVGRHCESFGTGCHAIRPE